MKNNKNLNLVAITLFFLRYVNTRKHPSHVLVYFCFFRTEEQGIMGNRNQHHHPNSPEFQQPDRRRNSDLESAVRKLSENNHEIREYNCSLFKFSNKINF